jgi:hypothetical protein
MATYQQSGPANFVELLRPLPQPIGDVATRLRAIVTEAIPEADEAVSGGARMGMALYSIDGPNNVICGIQPTESTCKLFFHGWQRLQKAGYRLEGSGKHARHIKISSREEIEPDRVADMIRVVKRAKND